ncbi:MAG: YggT family protein [Gemmatimonadales bacterium]
MLQFLAVARSVVFAVFAGALLVAIGSWLVRTRRISPFSPLGRRLRGATDPVIRPVETRVIRLGGNPVNAGWWLVVGVMIAGVLGLSLLTWLVGTLQLLAHDIHSGGGARAITYRVVTMIYDVLVVALVVRVIASWFGFFRYSPWLRPAYWLTDWLVDPIRRFMPPVAMFDLSPLVAWVVLWAMKEFVVRVLI